MRIISKYIAFTLVVLQSSVLLAQNESETPTYGVRTGMLLSKITGDEMYDSYAYKVFAGVGVFGNLFFNERLSVQGELSYMPKGAKFKSFELTTNLDYIEYATFAKQTFLKDPEFYIYGGGYFSYLIFAKTKGQMEDLNFDQPVDINENIRSKLNSFDYGVAIGAGVQGRFSKHLDIFLDVRYYYGIARIDNNSTDERYNLGQLTRFEVEYDTPLNRNLYITTGLFYYIDPR